jgi:transcription elongation factor Elf1
MKVKHKPAEKIECTICGHWIASTNLKTHMKKHKDEGAKCKICGKEFKRSISLFAHNKNVHSEKPKNFKCHLCEKAFYRDVKLYEHIAAAHTREFLYKCRVPGCTKKFRSEGNWKMHEKRAHPEEYEKIFKPFYKRAPNEPKPNVEEELKRLREANEVGELFEGF